MADLRNLVLTGFMGTGKSTIGRILAERLQFGFVDTDELIESTAGSIAQIFAERGEDAFRALEREAATDVSARTSTVVATGGRMLLDKRNADALTSTGLVVCLVADVDEIVRRVVADAERVTRPLLATPDPAARVRALLAERASGYGQFQQVDTTDRSPEAIVDEIIELWVQRAEQAV